MRGNTPCETGAKCKVYGKVKSAFERLMQRRDPSLEDPNELIADEPLPQTTGSRRQIKYLNSTWSATMKWIL